jgi:hypothetical protein
MKAIKNIRKALKKNFPTKFRIDEFNRLALILYFLVSGLMFYFFYHNAPPITGDAWLYDHWSTSLVKQNLDFINFDFGIRTFVYPTFLGVIKLLGGILGLNYYKLIYLVQFVLFHLTNYLIYQTLRKASLRISAIFMIVSAFNIINLSFVNLLLTENITSFLLALIFNKLSKNQFSTLDSLINGLALSLLYYVRYSFLPLVLCAGTLFIYKLLALKKVLPLLALIIGLCIPLLIGGMNITNTTGQLSFYNDRSSGQFIEMVYQGEYMMKYETSIDPKAPSQIMQYIYKKNYFFTKSCKQKLVLCISDYRKGCKTTLINCWLKALVSKPIEFVVLNMAHTFNLVDRVYYDTYVRNDANRSLLLRVGNYLIISSLPLLLVLFSLKQKERRIIFTAIVLIVGTLLIYIPTKVEARYSAPVFPLFILIFATYFNKVITERRLRYLWLNLLVMILLFLVSELVNLRLEYLII